MGCAHANSQVKSPQSDVNRKYFHQNIGLLTINIIELNYLAHNLTQSQTFYAHINLQFQNQSFISFLHHNFGHKKNITAEPSSFNLTINTFQKRRQISVQLFTNQQLRGSKKLAVSHFDVNSIIFEHQPAKIQTKMSQNPAQSTINMKLNNIEGVQLCSLFLIAKFTPQQYEILTIQVNSITLRNFSLKKRKVYFRIQIGEETFDSSSAEDDKRQIPTWDDALHTFIIPNSLKKGIIQVFQKKSQWQNDILLGSLRLNLETLLTQKNLQSYCEEITIKNQITGTIKLQIFKNIPSKDIEKLRTNQPKKIALQKQQIRGQNDLMSQINSMDSFRKTVENEPTTNFSSSRTKDLSQVRLTRESKSKSKSSNIYRKNHMVLPPIQSAPLTARQTGNSSWLKEIIEEDKRIKKELKKGKHFQIKVAQQKEMESSFEKVQIQSKDRLDIMRTQSHLIQKLQLKAAQQGQYELLEFAELPTLHNFFIQLTQDVETLDIAKISRQNTKNKAQQKIYTKVNPNFSPIQTITINDKKQQGAKKKLIQIDKDLQSRPPTPYSTQKDSNSCIFIQPGSRQFDLSLKEESNQSQNSNPYKINTFWLVNSTQQQPKSPHTQVLNEKGFQKIKSIKELSKFIDQDFFQKEKLNSSNQSQFQQQNIKNPQIQPQM